MTTKEYQGLLKGRLEQLFPDLEIEEEWISFKKKEYKHYSPKVDLAFGPFSVTANRTQRVAYNQLVSEPIIKKFLDEMYQFHIQNMREELYSNEYQVPDIYDVLHKNENARCFIALEIENKNSKKHMMGSIVNAASLGRIGIGVAYCDTAFKTMARVLHYW